MPKFTVAVHDQATNAYFTSFADIEAHTPLDALRAAFNEAWFASVAKGPLAPLPQMTHEELDFLYGVLDREIKRTGQMVSQANIAEDGGQRTSIADLREALSLGNSLRTAVGEARASVTLRDRALDH